jgi:hypothetical protein
LVLQSASKAKANEVCSSTLTTTTGLWIWLLENNYFDKKKKLLFIFKTKIDKQTEEISLI